MTTLHLGSTSIEEIRKFSGVEDGGKTPRVGWMDRMFGGKSTIVRLRRWEYVAYRIYDPIIYAIESVVGAIGNGIKVRVYRVSSHPMLRVEWRMENGKVVRRRWSGPYGSFKLIGGRVVKVSDVADVQGLDADFAIAEASEHATARADKKMKARVRDAELCALSSRSRRFERKTSEEIEWEAKNT